MTSQCVHTWYNCNLSLSYVKTTHFKYKIAKVSFWMLWAIMLVAFIQKCINRLREEPQNNRDEITFLKLIWLSRWQFESLLVFPNTLKGSLSYAPLSSPEIAAHYGFEMGWWGQYDCSTWLLKSPKRSEKLLNRKSTIVCAAKHTFLHLKSQLHITVPWPWTITTVEPISHEP